MGVGSIIANAAIIIIILAIVFFAIRKLYKTKKNGGGCAGCSDGTCSCCKTGKPAESKKN